MLLGLLLRSTEVLIAAHRKLLVVALGLRRSEGIESLLLVKGCCLVLLLERLVRLLIRSFLLLHGRTCLRKEIILKIRLLLFRLPSRRSKELVSRRIHFGRGLFIHLRRSKEVVSWRIHLGRRLLIHLRSEKVVRRSIHLGGRLGIDGGTEEVVCGS